MVASTSSTQRRATVLEMATTTCTPETVQRKHVFDIRGYSQHKLVDANFYISSGVFTVGGHDCAIRYCPGGFARPKYVTVFLELLSCGAGAGVRASCDLSLVNLRTGAPYLVSRTPPTVFTPALHRFAPATSKFMKRSKLESSGFVLGDGLVIECVVTVFTYPNVSRTITTTTAPTPAPAQPPPSDLPRDLASLYDSKVGADITFVVKGEAFSAHRTVLAMRSPTFMVELRDGQLGSSQSVTINDMEPAVFDALLYYIYKDSLPAMDHVDGADRKREILVGLIAAGDRFAIQRLKVMCESAVCGSLDDVEFSREASLRYRLPRGLPSVHSVLRGSNEVNKRRNFQWINCSVDA